LVLLYIISKNGISDAEREDLIALGDFSKNVVKAITNLASYGVKLSQSVDRDNVPLI
jgi:hypothetical protein